MASNLECVGLGVDDLDGLNEILVEVYPSASRIGHVDDLTLLRWEDASGARLVITAASDQVVDVTPSFAADASTRLGRIVRLNDATASATVVDEQGEQLTAAAVDLEQNVLLSDETAGPVLAGITFLGQSVTVHTDEAAFAESSESLLVRGGEPIDEGAPPADEPLRIASNSFLSYGIFGQAETAHPVARFAGIVVWAERRVVEITGQSFVVALVNSAGIDAHVCLAGAEVADVPLPGQILSGDVYVVASVPALAIQPPKRRRRKRFPFRS